MTNTCRMQLLCGAIMMSSAVSCCSVHQQLAQAVFISLSVHRFRIYKGYGTASVLQTTSVMQQMLLIIQRHAPFQLQRCRFTASCAATLALGQLQGLMSGVWEAHCHSRRHSCDYTQCKSPCEMVII